MFAVRCGRCLWCGILNSRTGRFEDILFNFARVFAGFSRSLHKTKDMDKPICPPTPSAKKQKTASEQENERWLITVAVGLDGSELSVLMDPEDTIELLVARATAECGKAGTLYSNKGELVPKDTVRLSGLSDQAIVHLQLEDVFAAEQRTLIAIRDHFKLDHPFFHRGWVNLEEFNEPMQLSKCRGVTVSNGRITKLDLSKKGLSGGAFGQLNQG